MRIKSGFFDKIFFNNRFLMVFSLLLSVALWATVKINFSDNTTRIISGVSVSIDSTLASESDFVPFGSEGLTADIEVSGKSYAINSHSLSKDDITIEAVSGYVDAAGYKVLSLTAKTSQAGVSVVSVNPSTVTVFYDKKAKGTFNVEASLKNAPAELVKSGYRAGQPVASLSTVDVSGPATVVAKIKKVFFKAVLDEAELPLTATKELAADITFDMDNDRGAQFLVCESIENATSAATVTVPVSRVKTVPTVVKFINEPAAFENNPPRVTIYPSKVEISYNPQDETDYESYNVGTVDFRSISNGVNTFEFEADEKSAVNLTDTSIKRFTASINMNTQSKKTIDARKSEVVVLNPADGCAYDVDLSRGGLESLTLVGPRASLDKITADKLRIEINVSSLSSERKARQNAEISNISIQTDEARECWVYGRYSAEIKVVRKQ